MDFRQLMGSMASGISSGLMDKDFRHAYEGGQAGFTDPLQGEHVKNKWKTINNRKAMDAARKEQAQLEAGRRRRMQPEPQNPSNYGGTQI